MSAKVCVKRVDISLCSDGVGAWVGSWGDADHDNTHIHMHHTQEGHAYTFYQVVKSLYLKYHHAT